MLLSSENKALLNHLLICKNEQSKKQITFLSPQFRSRVLRCVHQLVVSECIAEIIDNGGYYGLQVDTTQDISCVDQCSMVIRYVDMNFEIKERTIAFREMKKGKTGEELFNAVRASLQDVGLKTSCIHGYSLDGASSNTSEKKGLHYYLNKDNRSSIFIWCLSHKLNLVVSAACKSSNTISDIFDSAHSTAVFFKESTKRMNVWQNVVCDIGLTKTTRLQGINLTRWSSKFKSINNPVKTPEHFYVLLKSLNRICTDKCFDKDTKNDAKDLFAFWIDPQKIVTVFALNEILSIVEQLTVFLQTKGLDIFTAMNAIRNCYSCLNNMKHNVDTVFSKANNFVSCVYSLIKADKRNKMIEKFFSKKISTSYQSFEYIYSSFIDSLLDNFEMRFLDEFSQDLFMQIQVFNPENFENLLKGDDYIVSINKLCQVSNLNVGDEIETLSELKEFVKDYTAYQSEINCNVSESISECVSTYNDLTMNSCELTVMLERTVCENELTGVTQHNTTFEVNNTLHETEKDNLINAEIENIIADNRILNEFKQDHELLKNILKYLSNCNKTSAKFVNITKIYKFLLTLPVTQTKCERDFSQLKLIKNRLRSCLSERTLEDIIVITTERKAVANIGLHKIINEVAKTSQKLSSLLL